MSYCFLVSARTATILSPLRRSLRLRAQSAPGRRPLIPSAILAAAFLGAAGCAALPAESPPGAYAGDLPHDAGDPPPDAASPPDDAGLDAGVPDAPAPYPLVGLYAVKGADSRWGAFAGRAEVRPAPDGGLALIQVREWTEARFEGERIALAFEGSLSPPTGPDGPFAARVELGRGGFLSSFDGQARPALTEPLVLRGSLTPGAEGRLAVAFVPENGPPETGSAESWTRLSEPGVEPLWRNERIQVQSHPPIPSSTKDVLFQTYAAFHGRAEVAPYVSRPEFQEAMHFFIHDPTDFAFHRADPGVVRVVQKMVDPFSLAEARGRARAFRQTLTDKQRFFEAEAPARHLNAGGMVVGHDPRASPPRDRVPNGDSLLWTGVYAASQAMRFKTTGEPEARSNLLRAMRGLFLCHDIAERPGDFARTVREHLDDGDPKWTPGKGPYAAFDWLPGANNDMLDGFYVGFAWSFWALQGVAGHDADRQKMVSILETLLAHSSLVADKKGNELMANWLLFWMTRKLQYRLRYEALWLTHRMWMVDQGNGPTYENGTSDWSGNHLSLQNLLVAWLLARELGDGREGDLRRGMRNALERLRTTRLGLFQLVTGSLGDFPTPPPELEQSLWTLREFPAPKGGVTIDWRGEPSFCVSPFPNLPWKNDWMNASRMQSLVSYPLFERPPDDYFWKGNPFVYAGGGSPVLQPGVDYLFAYWFGRMAGVIDPGT